MESTEQEITNPGIKSSWFQEIKLLIFDVL